jgi:hypothetical protein
LNQLQSKSARGAKQARMRQREPKPQPKRYLVVSKELEVADKTLIYGRVGQH